MKKRILTSLLSLCLVVGLFPTAAFAVETTRPTTIWAHGEEVELPVVDRVETVANDEAAAISDSGIRTNQEIIISSIDDFNRVLSDEWKGNNTFILTGDLDLSQAHKSAQEWGGYIDFFDGTLIGVGDPAPKIYGFDNNTYLIYGMIKGTIENVQLELSGNAGAIYYMPATYSDPLPDDYYSVTMEDVTVNGYVSLTAADQSNYSPFAYAANTGDFTMKNCVNNADITGDIYGAVFHGYYALNTQGTYTFDHCVNNGDVKLRNTAMFFGNPSTMNDKMNDGLKVVIKDCENNGILDGSISAHYFVPTLNSQEFAASDTALIQMENSLLTGDNRITGNGSLFPSGQQENALTASIDEEDQSISFSYTGTDAVDHFVVSVGSYIQRWNTMTEEWDGTARYSVTEEIDAVANQKDYTANVKFYGVIDRYYGFETGIEIAGNAVDEDEQGNRYYVIIPEKLAEDNLFECYATKDKNGGCAGPDFATVSAVAADGQILSFCTLK